MKKFIFFLILGTCMGAFNLHAQLEKQISFGISGNMMRQEGDFPKKSQSCSMFSPGLYFDFKITESFNFETGGSFAYDFNSSYKNYQAIHSMPHIGISIRK
jgi:hypothetical protein